MTKKRAVSVKVLGVSARACFLFLLYLSISRTVVYNSDNASIVLEAQAILRGNIVLHGWYLPTDTYLTLDLPFYVLGLLLGFSGNSLLHIIPAGFYTVDVLCCVFLATTLLQGRSRLWGGLACLAIVALPSLSNVQNMLIGPIRTGTVCFFLLGLIAYRSSLRKKKGRKVACTSVLLLLLLTVIGDPYALVLFVLPLLLVEGLPILMSCHFSWREHVLIPGTVLAVVLALSLRVLLLATGTHILNTAGFVLTSPAEMLNNLRIGVFFLCALFSANLQTGTFFSLAGLPIWLNALLVIALISAMFRWGKHSLLMPEGPEDRCTALLLWSFLGIFLAFCLSTLGGGSGSRYLYPLIFLGSIACFKVLLPFIPKHALTVLLVLVLVTNCATFTVAFFLAPDARMPEASLISFLHAKHLTHGFGSYWVAAIVTIQSDEQIVLHQVELENKGELHPYYFLADQNWFTRANLQRANFIVYRDSDNPTAYHRAAVRLFGPPGQEYHIGLYTVLVWNTPLLSHLHPGSSF